MNAQSRAELLMLVVPVPVWVASLAAVAVSLREISVLALVTGLFVLMLWRDVRREPHHARRQRRGADPLAAAGMLLPIAVVLAALPGLIALGAVRTDGPGLVALLGAAAAVEGALVRGPLGARLLAVALRRPVPDAHHQRLRRRVGALWLAGGLLALLLAAGGSVVGGLLALLAGLCAGYLHAARSIPPEEEQWEQQQ